MNILQSSYLHCDERLFGSDAVDINVNLHFISHCLCRAIADYIKGDYHIYVASGSCSVCNIPRRVIEHRPSFYNGG